MQKKKYYIRGSPHGHTSTQIYTLYLLVIFALARSGKGQYTPAAVGAYIAAAYFFTSSTSFANPAITVARSLSDSFAGIAPSSVPGFILAQFAGALVAHLCADRLFPEANEEPA